jgi:hypothetical protein
MHFNCSFGGSDNSGDHPSSYQPNKSATTPAPRIHNSEPEGDQPKSNFDMKLTVNLDRLEVTLSRKETHIVGAVIEGN